MRNFHVIAFRYVPPAIIVTAAVVWKLFGEWPARWTFVTLFAVDLAILIVLVFRNTKKGG